MKYLSPLFPYALVGGILAGFYFVWLENASPVAGVKLAFVILYLWAVFGLAAYMAWTRVLSARLRLYSLRWRAWWLVGSLAAGFWLADNIPVVLPGAGVTKLFLFLCSGFGLGLLLFAFSVLLVTRFRPPNPPVERRWRWLALALPMIAAWLVYLLAFWPGMMSADSLDQWRQVLTGQYQNHHPAFHTFLIWLVTRAAPTPALVALAQILSLALVAGALLAYLESQGVAPRWVWLASIVLALSPVNGTMASTLWKDVPYSTAMLGFTLLVLMLVQSRGRWIAGRWAWLLLGAVAALAGLLRHNGLLVTAGTILVLLVAFRRQWKPLAAALAVSIALYFGVTGPVYDLVGVQRTSALTEAAATMYTLAATADPGSPVDGVFLSMDPLSSGWQCTIYGDLQTASQKGPDQPERLGTQALNLLEHAPSLLAYDYRCNRSLAWIIWDPNGEVRNPSHAEYWIDANPYGITPNSQIPALRPLIAQFVSATAHNPGINWLVWRPALYLYGFLAVIAIIALRRKNPWLLLIAAPALIQAVGAMLISALPNFRYYYSLYLLALTFWPILFLPYVPPAGAQPTSDAMETTIS